jgi:hypothetical protein
MKGTVFAYSTAMSVGVIRTDTGKLYLFNRADWPTETLPSADTPVAFASYAGSAKKIVFLSSREDKAA